MSVGLAEAAAGDALGGATLVPVVVGGRLVMQHGDEVVGVVGDAGRYLASTGQTDDAGRLIFEGGDGTRSVFNGGRQVDIPAPNRGQLIDDLVAGGTRITPEDVVDIRRLPDGRTVWMETGNADAGLQHIVSRHAREFDQWGIPEADIPDFVMQGLTRNNVVGTNNGTPVYLVGNVPTAMLTGNNGFVVTAYPVTNFTRY